MSGIEIGSLYASAWEKSLWDLAAANCKPGKDEKEKYKKLRDKIADFSTQQLAHLREAGIKGKYDISTQLPVKAKYFPAVQKMFDEVLGLKFTSLEAANQISISSRVESVSPASTFAQSSMKKFIKGFMDAAYQMRLDGSFVDCIFTLFSREGTVVKEYQVHRLVLAQLSDKMHTQLEKVQFMHFKFGEAGCSPQSLEWLIDKAYCVASKNVSESLEEWQERYLLAASFDCNLEILECRTALITIYKKMLITAGLESEQNFISVLKNLEDFAFSTQDETFFSLTKWAKSDPFLGYKQHPLS